MTTEIFTFPGAQGVSLSARFERPEGEPRHYALFAHCFTCGKDSAAAVNVSRGLAKRGVATLRFDFTGLGASEGAFDQTNFTSNVADIVAAADFLRARGQTPSLLIGHSLSGAAVLMAAHSLPECRAIATIGAPSELEHVTHHFSDAVPRIEAEGQAEVMLGKRRFTIRRQLLEDLSAQKLADRIPNLHRALLVMHAPLDNVVGVEHANRIYTGAKHPKSFVSLDDADHYLHRHSDADYAAGVIAAWAERYLAAA